MNETVIKVIETVPPEDYNYLKAKVVSLEKENEALRTLISEGNFSTLENMITNFKVQLVNKSKKITLEFSCCKYSKKNRALIVDLIETLEDLTKQFKDLLS